jgi:hypothetical protein
VEAVEAAAAVVEATAVAPAPVEDATAAPASVEAAAAAPAPVDAKAAALLPLMHVNIRKSLQHLHQAHSMQMNIVLKCGLSIYQQRTGNCPRSSETQRKLHLCLRTGAFAVPNQNAMCLDAPYLDLLGRQ